MICTKRYRVALATLVAIALALALTPMGAPAQVGSLTGWTEIAADGLGNSNHQWVIPWIEFEDSLYFMAPNPGNDYVAPLYTYDGTAFEKAADVGFGDDNNVAMYPTAIYDGYLYCGTENAADGGELWRSKDGKTWEQVGASGFGIPENQECLPLGVQSDELVVAFSNEKVGVRAYRYNGVTWSRANIDGFGDPGNTYTSLGATFNGEIYVMVNNTTGYNPVSTPYVYRGDKSWQKIGAAGFDDQYNQYCEMVKSDEEKVYVTMYNPYTGGQLWTYDGTEWTQEISGGHGDPRNSWVTTFESAGKSYLCTGGLGPVDVYRKIYRQDHNGNYVTWIDDSFADENNLIISLNYQYKGFFVAGTYNTRGFQVWTRPAPPADTYYFAEGTTRNNLIDGTYQEWISILNPNDEITQVHLTFMLENSENVLKDYPITPGARLTVDVAAEVGIDEDVSVKVVGDDPIVAERPMYFDYHGIWSGGHDVIGLTEPRDTFYFAEGTTRANEVDGIFQEWLCIQNPNDEGTTVSVTYMLGSGDTFRQSYEVDAASRRTIDVNAAVGLNEDVSLLVESTQPVVAERPMYFNYHMSVPGGHDVIGAAEPSTELYFAEGCTYPWAQEWICIQNPNEEEAKVTLRFQVTGEGEVAETVDVQPTSRHTVDVAGTVGLNKDVSVSLTSTLPVVAERPMYFVYQDKWPGGHDVMGTPATSYLYYFAEGTTRYNESDGYFDEWICIQNPGYRNARATIAFMKTDGTTIEQVVDVAAGGRETVSARDILGNDVDAAAVVSSNQPIVVERPIYFNYHGFATGGHDTIGYGI